MQNERDPRSDPGQTTIYQIRVKGHLGPQWTHWFGDLTLTLEDSGHTLLCGPVVDQAALYGLLRKVRDLAMPLISVIAVESSQTGASDAEQPSEVGGSRKPPGKEVGSR